MKTVRGVVLSLGVAAALLVAAFGQNARSANVSAGDRVQCANLIYAVNKTSVCYSDRFLARLTQETNIQTDPKFRPAHLGNNELFSFPFSIMTGEGAFTLTPKERINLRYYVTHGGFLVASASCSDPDWTRSFRSEMLRIFPEMKLAVIPLTHPIYRTVYMVKTTQTIHDHRGANLEGLFYKGRIVLVFSSDGLNDTSHAENCCCCGGDELDQSEYLNVDILAYALLH
ncbi:MAG: DUF4159 domain-containing protein [Fimbriimonadales bacterium]